MSEKIKFITDSNLGKLAKWLRILGYDTTCYVTKVDRLLLSKAQKEGRVVLTRKKDMSKQPFSGGIAFIRHDRVEDQLPEVLNKFSITPGKDQMLTICLKCNENLKAVSKEEIAGSVPDHILRNQTKFHICPRCGGIFWPGTHKENVAQFLTANHI